MKKQQLDVSPNTINVYKTKFAPSHTKHMKNAAASINDTLVKQTPDLIHWYEKLDLMDDSSNYKEKQINISHIESSEEDQFESSFNWKSKL